jgi:tetratricopeptide (TPR) repeat protein
MWKRISAFLVLGLLGAGSLLAQSIEQTYELAEGFYQRGDYLNAAHTYRRVLFFDEQNEYGPRCYLNIANCLYETEAYGEAAIYYDRAYYVAEQDSLQAEILFRKASCYLLTQSYRYAQVELFNLPDSLSAKQQSQKHFLEGMLYFALEEYPEAERHFLALAPDSSQREQVRGLFRENERISRLDPRKARRLSVFLPGLGQFYAGDVKNGVNSLLLTSGLLYWGIRLLLTGSSGFDAFITVMPWFQRYYTGGYRKAEAIAIAEKQRRRRQLYERLLGTVPTQE